MLIRSQNKTATINIDNVSCVEVRDINGGAAVVIEAFNYSLNIAEYSTKEKALKVLDMIQEAYADAELIPMTVPNIGKMFAEASASKENVLLAGAIGEVLMKKMVFQMPENSEV